MNDKELIELAEQVYGKCDWHPPALMHLKQLAQLVAQREREACAKVCEDSVEYAGDELARQIRARGQE
jgi:hypothetical protein